MELVTTICYVLYFLMFIGCFVQPTQGKTEIWQNGDGTQGGILYYRISDSLEECTKDTIRAVIKDFEILLNDGSSCIQLKETQGIPLHGEKLLSYVYFQYLFHGCEYQVSSPGMPPSGLNVVQIPVKVNKDCIKRSNVVYTLARVLGLPDEHTRDDRDSYINIHWDNIEKETIRAKKYNITSPMLWDGIESMPYDFTSVTHVGPFEHALDIRKPTISSKYEGVYFGNHQNLSVIDVMKLRNLYNCPTGMKHQGAMGFRPIHCTFDLPVCGMVNDWTLPGVHWLKEKGQVSEEGPKTDHSNGNGWYMFANGTESFNTARLVSITEVSPGDVCISMYYYLEDNSTYVRISEKESASNKVSQITKLEHNKGISWSEIRLTHTSTKTWRLLIEADVSNGTVAIDDVMVQYGKCPSSKECNNEGTVF